MLELRKEKVALGLMVAGRGLTSGSSWIGLELVIWAPVCGGATGFMEIAMVVTKICMSLSWMITRPVANYQEFAQTVGI